MVDIICHLEKQNGKIGEKIEELDAKLGYFLLGF